MIMDMADSIKSVGGAAPAQESIPFPPLPRDASKEQLLRAIRHLMTYLQHKPTSADAQHYLGKRFIPVAETHFSKPMHAIRVALIAYVSDHTKMNIREMVADKAKLATTLGHEPTPFEIDHCIEMAPAYAYKVLGLLNSAPPKREQARGTLADRSSFKPREVPAFTPTPDFKGHPNFTQIVADELQTMLQRVAELPPLADVTKDVWKGHISGSEDFDRPAPVETQEEARTQDVRSRLLSSAEKTVTPTTVSPRRTKTTPENKKGDADTVQASLQRAVDDPSRDGQDPIEVLLMAMKMGDGNYPRSVGVRNPPSALFMEYVARNGTILIPRFWRIQAQGSAAPKLSAQVIVCFYVTKEKGAQPGISGLRIMNASDVPPEGLPRDVTALHFKYSPRAGRYLLTQANGSEAADYVVKWAESQGIAVEKGLETNFMARTFGTRAPGHTTLWRDLEARIETEGGRFFERLWYISHPWQPLPRRIAFVADQRMLNGQLQAEAMRFERVPAIDAIDNTVAWMILEYNPTLRTYAVKSAGGTDGQSLGYAWFRSQGVDTSRLSVRSFVTLVWSKVKKSVLTLAKNELLLISDLKADLARPDYIPELLRARSLLEPAVNHGASSVTLVTQCLRDKEKYSGLRLLTEAEGSELAGYGDYTKVTLQKGPQGRFAVASALGREGKQFLQSATQLNDVTYVMASLVTTQIMRGGAVFFLGDKLSDVMMGNRPVFNPKEMALDYGALTAGTAVGAAMTTKVFRLPAQSLLGRAFPLFSALTTLEFSHTGHVNLSQLPISAGNVLVASGIVSAATGALATRETLLNVGKVMRLVNLGGKATLAGAVIVSAAEFTIIKALNQVEAQLAESGAFAEVTAHVAQLLSADSHAIALLSQGQDVPIDYFETIDQQLAIYEQSLSSRPGLAVRQTEADYAATLAALRDNYETKVNRPLDGTWSRSEVTATYEARRRTIEAERSRDLAAARAQEDHRFTRLAVDLHQVADQLLDTVDEDTFKADVDVDGNPRQDNKVLQYQAVLARDWAGLAAQIAQYRRDRAGVIQRYHRQLTLKVALSGA